MEEGAASRKEGLRGATEKGRPSRGEGGAQEGNTSLLAEEGAVAAGARGAGVAPDPPSGAPAPNEDSWIHRMLGEVLKASSLRVSLPEAPPVTVLLLHRYMADGMPTPPQAGAPCPAQAAPCPSYFYDMTVTDGVFQEKCHLDPQLNGLIHRNKLGCGMQVKITQCSYVYNEKRLGHGFLCIEQLEILEGPAFTDAPPQLKVCHVKSTLPLKGGKKHYLPLWNNDDPCGDMWVEKKPLREVCVDEFKLTSLFHLAMTWETRINFQPLLVRIIHKSRLRYYGKPKTKLDVPYQAYFDVADHSGMVLMVLWGSLCPEWYHSMKIGTVLLLEKYAVKKSLSSKTQSSPGDLQMKRFCSIEIALNVRDPPAKINIIPEHKIKPEWKLPEVEYQFITRSELDELAQNHFCDIIGLVQYVGRIERKRKKGCVDDFWTYRWVHVIDGTSEQPFIVELFATSQPDIFEQIHPKELALIAISETEKEIDSLHYREQKRIAFQGIISAIRCVSCSSTSQDASGVSPMQIKKRSSVSESDHINKGRKKYQQTGESASKQKSPPLEQRNIVTRSCSKRQIATVEATDHHPVPSQHSYLTRAAGKKRMLRKFLQDNSHAKKESKEVMETAQTYETGNKEIADGFKEVHTQRMYHNSWESVLWTAVKDNLTQHLNFSKVFPESFPCKFNYIHKEFLMKQYNLQAAKFEPKERPASGEMNHFESACPLEYYEVAILGINHDIAIEVALLHDSYLFQVKDTPQNAVSSHVSGTSSCQETINQEGPSELLTLSDEDVKAAALENQRVVCILDICSLDKDKTEVFLRKIYKITDVNVVNQT
ncbi:RPA-related protein RADX isoform 5-T5 [Liasis olivaceus]